MLLCQTEVSHTDSETAVGVVYTPYSTLAGSKRRAEKREVVCQPCRYWCVGVAFSEQRLTGMSTCRNRVVDARIVARCQSILRRVNKSYVKRVIEKR